MPGIKPECRSRHLTARCIRRHGRPATSAAPAASTPPCCLCANDARPEYLETPPATSAGPGARMAAPAPAWNGPECCPLVGPHTGCGWPGSVRCRWLPARRRRWCPPGPRRSTAPRQQPGSRTGHRARPGCPVRRAVLPRPPMTPGRHPGPAGLAPFRLPPVQPARVITGSGQPGEAPAGGGLIEPLACPFHDHRPAARHQRLRRPVQHRGQIGDMVQRRACHDGVQLAGHCVPLELDLAVGGSKRGLGVDTGRLVTRRLHHGDEAAPLPAPDLEDPGWRDRERGAYERPVRGSASAHRKSR